MRIAVIDLGTNTFNLLIVELHSDNTFHSVFQTKISVKLGEGGINSNFIVPVAFARGLDALQQHQKTIQYYNVERTFAFATSAIRGASNGSEFVTKAKEQTGIDIQVISGDKEAEYIYYGVRQAVAMNDNASLIIDIGGGSTEFIIGNKETIFWKQSFLLGAARLLERFCPSDPMTDEEILLLKNYLQIELKPLLDAVKKYPVTELIGSSGSFDSLAEMVAYKFHTLDVLTNKTEFEFNLDECNVIYEEILHSTKDQRMQMKGLVAMRVDMIVISSILVHLVISELKIDRMRLSTYSLKEGVLHQIIK